MGCHIYPTIVSSSLSLYILVHYHIDLVQDIYQWSRFLSWIAISSYTGRFWWSIFRVLFIVPITLYTFFRTVYDFGPKHCKRSLFDILRNPVPGIEFEGRPGESDDIDSLRHRQFNHSILARRIARRKRLTQKQTTQSMVQIVHDCRIFYIDPTAPRLHGYQTYFTLNSESS